MSRPSARRTTGRDLHAAHATVIGSPGASTRQQYRAAVAAYRRIPLKWLGIGAVLALGVIGAGAHSIGAHPVPVIVTVAAVMTVLDLSSRFPGIAATITVVIASSVLAAPMASLYAAAATRGTQFDQAGAVATLVATLTLAGLLAHRTSRGRPWVTTLLVALTITLLSPWLLLLAPTMGFLWAWVAMTVVLFLRGGGIAWIRDQWQELTDVLTRRRIKATAMPVEVRDLDAKQTAQVDTAQILADLPAEYTVFHDRRLPSGTRLDHIVVGPTGVFLIEAHKFKGRVIEDPTAGLTHATVPVADILNQTDTAAATIHARLGSRAVRVHPVVVIHDAVLPTSRAQVALSAGSTTLGTVTILAPSALLAEIIDPEPVCPTRQVTRLVSRIDRACPPATAQTTTKTRPALGGVSVAVLDEHGHPKQPTPAADTAQPLPLFNSSTSNLTIEEGQPVTLLTDAGTFDGYWVTGAAQPNDDGILVVPVASVDHDTVVWFPLDSIQPDPALG